MVIVPSELTQTDSTGEDTRTSTPAVIRVKTSEESPRHVSSSTMPCKGIMSESTGAMEAGTPDKEADRKVEDQIGLFKRNRMIELHNSRIRNVPTWQ